MPPFLLVIGRWLLKILLGGLVGNIQNKEADTANRQKDAALLHATTVEEGMKVEREIEHKQSEVEAQEREKVKTRAPNDPFGANDWNKGT